jgi:peptidoglycan/LPS O-acetylase OafA/YrhL
VIFFGAFFAAGWLLHDGRGHWGRLPHIAPFLTAVGLIIATGLSVTSLQWTRLGFFASSLAAWLSSVGLMGLALRPRLRGDVSSPTTTFLVQSAYWVYLIHHPLVQLGQALVAPTGWPALLSYAIVVVGALALSCASFAVLVRPTPLARYLAAGRPPVSLEPVSAGSHTLPAQPASSVTKDV